MDCNDSVDITDNDNDNDKNDDIKNTNSIKNNDNDNCETYKSNSHKRPRVLEHDDISNKTLIVNDNESNQVLSNSNNNNYNTQVLPVCNDIDKSASFNDNDNKIQENPEDQENKGTQETNDRPFLLKFNVKDNTLTFPNPNSTNRGVSNINIL